jgi:hypothetical protein
VYFPFDFLSIVSNQVEKHHIDTEIPLKQKSIKAQGKQRNDIDVAFRSSDVFGGKDSHHHLYNRISTTTSQRENYSIKSSVLSLEDYGS